MMRKILSCIFILFISLSAIADDHSAKYAEIQAAKIAFEDAYGTNDVEKYFSSTPPPAAIKAVHIFWYGATSPLAAPPKYTFASSA